MNVPLIRHDGDGLHVGRQLFIRQPHAELELKVGENPQPAHNRHAIDGFHKIYSQTAKRLYVDIIIVLECPARQ